MMGSSLKDLVTVYIITLNRIEFLKRSIDSVLNQSYENIELIVVDNGSSDGTQYFLKQLENDESRLSCIYLPNNMGACFARNRAINLAAGIYITGMDDDDYFAPMRVESLLSTYKSQQCSFVYSDDGYVQSGKQLKSTNKPDKVDLKLLKFQNLVGNQVLSKTSCFKKVGGFDESLRAAQDYDMWLRMVIEFGTAVKSDGITQYLESGDHSRISTSTNKFKGYMQFYQKHKSIFNRAQKKHQLLNIKYACRSVISKRVFLTLFDRYFIKRKLKVFITRVIKRGSYEY